MAFSMSAVGIAASTPKYLCGVCPTGTMIAPCSVCTVRLMTLAIACVVRASDEVSMPFMDNRFNSSRIPLRTFSKEMSRAYGFFTSSEEYGSTPFISRSSRSALSLNAMLDTLHHARLNQPAVPISCMYFSSAFTVSAASSALACGVIPANFFSSVSTVFSATSGVLPSLISARKACARNEAASGIPAYNCARCSGPFLERLSARAWNEASACLLSALILPSMTVRPMIGAVMRSPNI